MSVINQMLNRLEQRGVHTAAEQAMVRAVPRSRRKFTLPLLMTLGGMVAIAAAWQWTQARKPNAAAASIAPKAGNPPSVAVPERLTVQPQSAVLVEQHPAEKLMPALRQGMESSAASLPANVQVKPVISSVGPNPVMATGVPAPLSINGSNFAQDAMVTLRSSDGKVYAKRTASSRSDTRIVINPNLGRVPDTWTVEVSNSNGVSSGLFAFMAQAPLAAAKPGSGQLPVAAIPAKDAPDEGKLLPAKAGEELPPPMKQVSTMQQADAEFRKAAALMQKGRLADAMAGYEAALRLDAGHDAARQALVALLLENKRGADAERVLQDRLESVPEHTGFTMILARLQVERGALAEAIATLEKALPYADAQADYQAFLAALLQRQDRHGEAIVHYQVALQIAPDNGIWLMGYGISLQAIQRNADAKEAFKRALDTQTLSTDLRAFVQAKIKAL